MANTKKSELNKAIIAIEAERAKHPDAPHPDLTKYPKILRTRRAEEELIAEHLRVAGLDTSKLALLREQCDAELQRAVEHHKAAAIRRSLGKKGAHYSSILGQSKAAGLLADIAGSFALPEPFLIWATPQSNIISDSKTAPFNSWAKTRVDTSLYEGFNKLSFYFEWTNPLDNYVVIDPITFMIATGYLEANADWAVLVNTSYVSAKAQIFLWQWWQQPPVPILSASASLGEEQAVASYFRSDRRGESISAGVTLNAANFFVPPRSPVVFEVAFNLSYNNNEGHIVADFESGNFEIICPVVAFSALQLPF